MNFTRDPIIETVITPREGCKLVVRSSKGANQEDYFVDALEVVSFGHSFFFRSLERPKSFLVPVSDYEIFESAAPKMILKNAPADRSIKIGGGRDMASRPSREAPIPEMREDVGATPPSERKQRDNNKRRRGRRGGRDRNDSYAPQEGGSQESFQQREESQEAPADFSEKSSFEEAPKEKAPSFISKLFPPPTTLIKETLSRYKSIDPAAEDLFPMTSRDSVSLEENGSIEDVDKIPYSEPRSDEETNEEE